MPFAVLTVARAAAAAVDTKTADATAAAGASAVVFRPQDAYLCWPGRAAWCVPQSNATWFAQGLPESKLIQWAGALFCRPDGVFVDAGAHVGTYTICLAPLVEQVHAFECQKDTYYALCGSIALSNLASQVTAHQVALGDPAQDGASAVLEIVSPDGGGSTLDKAASPSAAQPTLQKQTVCVRALDEFELRRVCLLKIDVEGHERAVLQGAVATLKANGWPPLVLEMWVHDCPNVALEQWLHDHQYVHHPIPGFPHMQLALSSSAAAPRQLTHAQCFASL